MLVPKGKQGSSFFFAVDGEDKPSADKTLLLLAPLRCTVTRCGEKRDANAIEIKLSGSFSTRRLSLKMPCAGVETHFWCRRLPEPSSVVELSVCGAVYTLAYDGHYAAALHGCYGVGPKFDNMLKSSINPAPVLQAGG